MSDNSIQAIVGEKKDKKITTIMLCLLLITAMMGLLSLPFLC